MSKAWREVHHLGRRLTGEAEKQHVIWKIVGLPVCWRRSNFVRVCDPWREESVNLPSHLCTFRNLGVK